MNFCAKASPRSTRAFRHDGLLRTRVDTDLVTTLSERNRGFCRSPSLVPTWLELCNIEVFAHGRAIPENNQAAGS